MKDDLPNRIKSLPTATASADLDQRIASLRDRCSAHPQPRWSRQLLLASLLCVIFGFAAGYGAAIAQRGHRPLSQVPTRPDAVTHQVDVVLLRSTSLRHPFDFSPEAGPFGSGELSITTHVSGDNR